MHHFSWVFLLRLTACPGPPKELKHPGIHAPGPCHGMRLLPAPVKKTTVSLTQQTTADKNTVSRQQEDSRWISLQKAPANTLRVPHRPPVHCESQPAGCCVAVQVRAAPLPLGFYRSPDKPRLSSFSVNSPNVTVQTLSPQLLRQRHPRDRQDASQWLHLDRPCFHGNREESAPHGDQVRRQDFRDHSLIKK